MLVKSIPPSCNTGGIPPEAPAVLVDWVRFSFDEEHLENVIEALGQEVFDGATDCVARSETKGLWGYANGWILHGDGGDIGRVFWGGDNQRGRATFEASGPQCARLDMRMLAVVVEVFEGTLTRIDLAADFHNGEVTLADALDEFHAGGFIGSRGVGPRARFVDDQGSGQGSTLYIGSREGSKFTRIYEKGKQLGDPSSQWLRFEVEFKRRDYDLPTDILRQPAQYLAGSYPIAAEWLKLASTSKLQTISKDASLEVGHALHHARLQVGGVVAFLRRRLHWTRARVVHELMRSTISAKLDRHAPNVAYAEQFFDPWEPPPYLPGESDNFEAQAVSAQLHDFEGIPCAA